MKVSYGFIAVLVPLHVNAFPAANPTANATCRCMIGDPCWPTEDVWSKLNSTVGGRLIKTVPLASPCHDPTYNAEACDALKVSYPRAENNFPSPYSVFPPLFQGNSCLPYTPESSSCTIGKNIRYAINVSSTDHIAAGLDFAQKNNIRLVIKNTGHDLLGKSAGASGLGLWTHHLKSISFPTYSSSYYNGPAVKLGSGVEAWEAIEAASAQGLKVLGGSCSGVSIAGGFAQGGGHSPLSSTYGLAADNVLEWEVVTASGNVVTASPTENSDLYWALSGGGGSTFGVVYSMTMRAWPDTPIAGAQITIVPSPNMTDADFRSAIRSFHTHLPTWTSKGATTAHLIGKRSLQLYSLTWPDHTANDTRALLSGWQSDLDALGIPYTSNFTVYPTYLAHYAEYFGPLPYGFPWLSQVQGGRLVPTTSLSSANASALDALLTAIQTITADGVFQVLGNGVDVSLSSTPQPLQPPSSPSRTFHQVAPNAVLPTWRTSAYSLIAFSSWNFTLPWSSNLATQNRITDTIDPLLRQALPNSGSYLSEANPYLSTWKEDFYGENYAQLRSVKGVWDPEGVFYARTGVGSGEWVEDGGNGRLCRV
ncbi:MAG: hypothetical protein Q9227_004898 [Pyrenula ochraceoflavens]